VSVLIRERGRIQPQRFKQDRRSVRAVCACCTTTPCCPGSPSVPSTLYLTITSTNNSCLNYGGLTGWVLKKGNLYLTCGGPPPNNTGCSPTTTWCQERNILCGPPPFGGSGSTAFALNCFDTSGSWGPAGWYLGIACGTFSSNGCPAFTDPTQLITLDSCSPFHLSFNCHITGCGNATIVGVITQ